jgi:hypothetical protein
MRISLQSQTRLRQQPNSNHWPCRLPLGRAFRSPPYRSRPSGTLATPSSPRPAAACAAPRGSGTEERCLEAGGDSGMGDAASSSPTPQRCRPSQGGALPANPLRSFPRQRSLSTSEVAGQPGIRRPGRRRPAGRRPAPGSGSSATGGRRSREAPEEGIRVVNETTVAYESVRFTIVPSRDEPTPVNARKVEYDEPGVGFAQRWIEEGETWDLGPLGPGEFRLLDLRRPDQSPNRQRPARCG